MSHQCWYQCLRSGALVFEHLRNEREKRGREKHTQTSSFFFYYTQPLLSFFFCVSCLSLIHSLCYHPTLICHCIFFPPFLSLFFYVCLGFKDSLFSFCSSAVCLSLGLTTFDICHFADSEQVGLPSTILNTH